MFFNVKVGDEVTRLLAGKIKMPLKVTDVTDSRIICGPWQFDKLTGAEIDEECGWGPVNHHSGSYLIQGE